MMLPAAGAIRIVKNPKAVEMKPPIAERTAATMNATT
jgi:hypothetical protein